MLIKVKHLIQFLNQLDENLIVDLDKNGWTDDYDDEDEEQVEDGTELSVIEESGLFWRNENCLIINN